MIRTPSFTAVPDSVSENETEDEQAIPSRMFAPPQSFAVISASGSIDVEMRNGTMHASLPHSEPPMEPTSASSEPVNHTEAILKAVAEIEQAFENLSAEEKLKIALWRSRTKTRHGRYTPPHQA